jgi:hypothetical protein
MDKYSYECPRCGQSLGANVVPIDGPPVCINYSGHHSKKSYNMTFVPSKSKHDEPNPYPKSKKKVIYT